MTKADIIFQAYIQASSELYIAVPVVWLLFVAKTRIRSRALYLGTSTPSRQPPVSATTTTTEMILFPTILVLHPTHTLRSSPFPTNRTSPLFNDDYNFHKAHQSRYTLSPPSPPSKPTYKPYPTSEPRLHNPPLNPHRSPCPSSFSPRYPLCQLNRFHNYLCDSCLYRIEKVIMVYMLRCLRE